MAGLDTLLDAAKAQIGSIRAVDEAIQKLEQQLSIHKTARAAYARALQEELNLIEPH